MFLEGTTYYRPAVDCPVVQVNPNFPAVQEMNARWCWENLPFPDEASYYRFMRNHHCLWAGVAYPTASAGSLRIIADCNDAHFYLDEVGFDSPEVFEDLKRELFSGRTPSPGTAARSQVGRALAQVHERIREAMLPGTHVRYLKAAREGYEGVSQENELRSLATSLTFADYLPVRRRSITIYAWVVLAELGLDLDLGELLAEDTNLDHMSTLVVDHMIYINDLASFRKERFVGDYMNAVAVLMHEQRLSLQAAVEHVTAMADDVNRQFAAASGDLRERYARHPRVRDIERYLEALSHMVSGNVWWSYVCGRYNGQGFIWNGYRSGDVTLRADGTLVHLPAQNPITSL